MILSRIARISLYLIITVSATWIITAGLWHWHMQTSRAKARQYYEIGKQFHAHRDLEHAIQAYKKTLAYDNTHEFAHKAMGYAYLDLGDLPHAWEQFKLADTLYKATADNPWWDGSNPSEKTILIQDAGGFDGNPSIGKGFGDCFQALRYVKELKKYKTRIIMQARPTLVPLLSQCPYIDTLISLDDPCPSCDIKTTTARLFQNFNTSIGSIPHETPYVFADPALIQLWQKKLAHDKNFKIGLCWNSQHYALINGSGKHILHDPRPIPVDYLIQLAQLPHISLYSLQKTDADPHTFKPIITWEKDFDTKHGAFMDTAALMKNLDLIITVDTSIAHLAGALGVPVWVLLPRVADWRWFSGRNDSPWYPTMRLFRQPAPGDWHAVMQEVQQELLQYKNNKKAAV
jgi:tetratricopeptide (TPR) repeat protein